MGKRFLTHQDCLKATERLAQAFHNRGVVFGVPRGGIPVAYLLRSFGFNLTDDPHEADLIVDDIVDSGATKQQFSDLGYTQPFVSLADFLVPPRQPKEWLVFPWEQRGGQDLSPEDIFVRLIEYVGEDPKREGLRGTPSRMAKAWKEWTSGYGQDPRKVVKTFRDGIQGYDEMVVVKNLPFHSLCEHHGAPFFGTAVLAYIPDQEMVGLSKLSRILDIFARRLQVQERLTVQVADTLVDLLHPKGVGVTIKARHLCMESRGISKQGHETITSALRGEFLSDHKVRDEFLRLAQ